MKKQVIIDYELYHKEIDEAYQKGVNDSRDQVVEDIVTMIDGESNLVEAVQSGKLMPDMIPKQNKNDYEIIQKLEKAIMRLRNLRT